MSDFKKIADLAEAFLTDGFVEKTRILDAAKDAADARNEAAMQSEKKAAAALEALSNREAELKPLEETLAGRTKELTEWAKKLAKEQSDVGQARIDFEKLQQEHQRQLDALRTSAADETAKAKEEFARAQRAQAAADAARAKNVKEAVEIVKNAGYTVE